MRKVPDNKVKRFDLPLLAAVKRDPVVEVSLASGNGILEYREVV